MSMKKLIPIALFLCSTASLAGGTVHLVNKTGMPIEVFMKSSIESEVGKPIFNSRQTHKIVGPKASSYSFTLRTLDPTSLQPSEQSSYISFLVSYSHHYYSLETAGKILSATGAKICYYVTDVHYDEDGPHDFDVDLVSCY